MISPKLQVEAAILYPGMRPTVLRIRLRYSILWPQKLWNKFYVVWKLENNIPFSSEMFGLF